MDAPDGAILKAWGWQKHCYTRGDREVWMGFSTGGKTSHHHHERHNQTLHVLQGSLTVDYDFGEGSHVEGLFAGCKYWMPSGWKHHLTFEPGTLFLETYRKEGDNCPPVTEDTIREGA